MFEHSGFKTVALAASIALAMAATSAMAADPAANALPGQGKVVAGSLAAADVEIASGTSDMTVANGDSSNVINWGANATATGLNNTGAAGFNIGSKASVTFTGTGAVLNIDSTGNASQIFGALTSTGSVFVANSNGIIVGSDATIEANVGLIANTLVKADGAGFEGSLDTVAYKGTGGDVTVQPGATIGGGSVFIAGGGTVNVDLSEISAASVDLRAGLPSDVAYDVPNNSFTTTGGLSAINTKAALNLTGSLPTGSDFKGAATNISDGIYTVGGLASGGNITSNGTVDASNAGTVAAGGTLTNNGSFTWGHQGGMTPGNVVNNGTMTLNGSIDIGGSLTNDGKLGGKGHVILANGVNNAGSILVDVIQSQGDFTNSGVVTTAAGAGPVLLPDGFYVFPESYPQSVTVIDGNFSNSGELTSGGVSVANGSLSNSGQLTAGNLSTTSDKTLPGFSKTGAYFIDNTGTITGADLVLSANGQGSTPNGSTGSITNSGMLQLTDDLQVHAHDDINLGGSVQMYNDASGEFAAVSAKNPLSDIDLKSTDGVVTLSTPIAFSGDDSFLMGSQVKVMANVTGGETSRLVIAGGDKMDDDYAIRIGSGATVSAETLFVGGMTTELSPNVILQGKLAAASLNLGGHYVNDDLTGDYTVSDVFSGPSGGLVAMGDAPAIGINFTGRIKTAPYLNADNFRYNGLPITLADAVTSEGGPNHVALTLNPAAYETNGTSEGLSAVNILVDGSVALTGMDMPSEVAPALNGGSIVTGLNSWENTHLVLQSTGSITTSSFYWPGYVYLGNIGTNGDGSAAPGTLGLGSIGIDGYFSNVLPGSLDNGGGIHFITQFPLQGEGTVATNGGSWVNFASDMLTQGYASGALEGISFFGAKQGPGNVVNYGELDASMFHTHAPVASK